MKLSIIIPIYNSELYLSECLDSILNQSYSNYEVIMVNDGSTDNSKSICESYVNKDKRFILINKENSGVSSSRNVGIDKSTGDYLLFMDSDDYYTENTFENIINHLDDNDMLIFGYTRFTKINNRKFILNDNDKLSKETLSNMVINNQNISGMLCNKVFKSSIVKNNKLYLDKEIHFCEDFIFTTDYLKYIDKVSYLSKSLYNYRSRKSSASVNLFQKKNITILNAYEKLIKMYYDDEELKSSLMFSYLCAYRKLGKKILKNFTVNKKILSNEREVIASRNFKSKVKYYFIKYFHFIYNLLYKVKYCSIFHYN